MIYRFIKFYFLYYFLLRNPVPEGCKPKLFWHLARHGTRNPGDDDIVAFTENLFNFRYNI